MATPQVKLGSKFSSLLHVTNNYSIVLAPNTVLFSRVWWTTEEYTETLSLKSQSLHSIWGDEGKQQLKYITSSFSFLLDAKNLPALLNFPRLSTEASRIAISPFYHMPDSTWCFLNSTSSWEPDARQKINKSLFQEEVSTVLKHVKTQEFSCLVNLKNTNSPLSKPSFVNLQLGKLRVMIFFFQYVYCISNMKQKHYCKKARCKESSIRSCILS